MNSKKIFAVAGLVLTSIAAIVAFTNLSSATSSPSTFDNNDFMLMMNAAMSNNLNLRVRFKLGVPAVVRTEPTVCEDPTKCSPALPPAQWDELDTKPVYLKKSDGTYLFFSSGQTVFSIPSTTLFALEAGQTRAVVNNMGPGTVPPYDTPVYFPAIGLNYGGNWLQSVNFVNGTWYGLVHMEQILYPNATYLGKAVGGTDFKSMAMYTSSDGINWSAIPGGPIIMFPPDPADPEDNQGEGDCTMMPSSDGYMYAYCGKYYHTYYTFVARAPLNGGLGPHQWHNYYQGQWNEDSVNGHSDNVNGWIGTSVASIPGLGKATLVSIDPVNGVNGMFFSYSNDMINFSTLSEPLLLFDDHDWTRKKTPYTDLFTYPALINPNDGSNVMTSQNFLFYYVLRTPGSQVRHLVAQNVTLTLSSAPQAPHVLTALSRFVEANGSMHVTAAAPLPFPSGIFNVGVTLQKTLGYVMTAAQDVAGGTVKLEECEKTNGYGNPNYVIGVDGNCTGFGYTRIRSVGFVYRTAQANTLPLYQCYNSAKDFHFASNDPACEGGTNPALLGYVLAN